ncbi:MAG TPA: hypothetical protein PKM59_11455 [Thermodesulfobacteriota bacterium]|nr:hypothetical protein [Thermodesulfobacteriota bacterium]HNU71830.1 hypothetical protein [Thermodesulfobacteriota bacterium]
MKKTRKPTDAEKKRQVAPKITAEAYDFLKSHHGTPGAGATFWLDALPRMFQETIVRLVDSVSEDEMAFLHEVLTKTEIGPQMAGKTLLVEVHRRAKTDRLSSDQDPKEDKLYWSLVNKLYSMTVFEAACLEIWLLTEYTPSGMSSVKKALSELGMIGKMIDRKESR